MAFSRHFYPEHNFALTQCHGIVDDNSLRIHILSFNIEAQGMQNIREIADIRGLENASKVTVRGLVELAELGKERAAGRNGLLAMLVPDNPLIEKLARLYGSAVDGHKKATRIFLKAEDALHWLGYEDPEAGILLRFIRTNRVKTILPGH